MKMTLQTYQLQTRQKATVAMHWARDDTGQSSIKAETRVGKLAFCVFLQKTVFQEVQQSQAHLR